MKLRIALAAAIVLAASGISPASAVSKWTPISSSSYIFGFTSYTYSCWQGVTDQNPPIIEVFSNNIWVKAASGQLLPPGSDLEKPCGADYPIAVGFIWTVLAPTPPAYQTNRYSLLYRERIPDTEYFVQELVTKQVYVEKEICCKTKVSYKKVPYIARVKKNGKYTNVIKYKTVKTQEPVTYIESFLEDKSEWQDVKKIASGWTGQPGNVSVYTSESAMISEYSKLGNAIACALGSGTNCKK